MEEAASANNQSFPITPPPITNHSQLFTTYSSAVHKVVVMVNAGILGLLQLVSQQSSVLETHKVAFLCFCVFVLFYAILRVREAIDMHLRPGLVPRFVGHMSHLFGGLAAIVLISVVSAAFALAILLLWFLWLSAVVYNTLNEVMIYLKANKSGTGLPQLPPV